MRAIKFFAASLIGLACSTLSFSQTTTTTFKVNGNCGMCKSAIEKAAKTAGAEKADWNKDTKELTVTYSTVSTNTALIQQKVASVGYTATSESYDKLHSCCKYDRTAMASMKDKKAGCGANCDMKEGKCDMAKCDMSKCTDKSNCKDMGDCAGKSMGDMDCCKDGKCSKEGHKGGDCCVKK